MNKENLVKKNQHLIICAFFVVSELQSKVDSMAMMLLYMQKANTDLCLDIKAIINASNKAQRERTQAEEHKYQQVEH